MPALSAGALSRRLRALSGGERLAFLAAVWRARGYETRVDRGEGVVHASRDGEALRVAPVGRLAGLVGGPPAADVYVGLAASDRLRRLAAARDAQLYAPDDLRDLLLYGLDREHADRLARDHLGGPLTVPARPAPDRRTPVLATLGVVLAAALLLAATAGAGAGVSASVSGGVSGALAGPTDGSESGASADGDGSPTLDDSTDISDVDPDGALYDSPDDGNGDEDGETAEWTPSEPPPPGLTEDGVTDPDALVDAHYRSSERFSRELTITFEGPANTTLFPAVIRHDGVARIHNRTSYRLRIREMAVEGTGTGGGNRTFEAYAADGRRHSRFVVGNETRQRQTRRIDEATSVDYEIFAGIVMRRALSADETAVTAIEGPRPRYRVTARGRPPDYFDHATDFAASATVRLDGRISWFRLRYVHEPTGREVVLRISYGTYGGVDPPSEPDWVREGTTDGGSEG